MRIEGPMDRREALSTLSHWSGAALSLAGLGGLGVGCHGNHGHHCPPTPPRYNDYANYANYFDYANYVNYGDYLDQGYLDYADYANYANYGDYLDYADAYGDSYADYGNYANYANYSDYSNYSDYNDGPYANYSDYSNYADYADAYANYSDSYFDAGELAAESPATRLGRVPHAPAGLPTALPKGAEQSARGTVWRHPEQAVDRRFARNLNHGHKPQVGEPHGQEEGEVRPVRQGAPEALIRPERQKPGRRSRAMDGQPGSKGESL